MKNLEGRAFQAFVDTMTRVPEVKVNGLPLEQNSRGPLYEADFIAEVWHGSKKALFVAEVKQNGQPRHAAAAIAQLKHYIAGDNRQPLPVFVAPFLSKDTRALCESEGVNYIDLAGNVRIMFDGVYIEREAADNPFKERRKLRSLFSPKAAQALKLLLREPRRRWRMADLAAAARVSLGQISNVKTALLEQDWASVENDGLALSKPDVLLDEWRGSYRGVAGSVLHFYTTMHGPSLNNTILTVLSSWEEPHAALASFSAAQWYAPYARVGHDNLYADQEGLDRLVEALKLTPADKGGNIIITFLYDEMPLVDAEFRGPGLWCTSPVQTYLDLSNAGDRGREAADFLRQEALSW